MFNKLMIVAHPDDEIIFGGAQLIKGKGWKVICVTNGKNKVRAREFRKAMKDVGAEYEMWSYKDKWEGDFNRKALKKDIAQVLQANPQITMIVTHNKKGEYGHTQHRALHQVVRELAQEKMYIFKRSKYKLPEDLIKQKHKILKRYRSQDIEWLKKYTDYESIRKLR
ncbi:PIG-L family deacetylase [Paenibacillus xylanilyticus]|uniref:PIG-L family deacetylase n=1 Tax=Paenibacillus xylanilyticus TaxID=248903 RepID=A0A7Y6BU65_9BACL|nr:PIG-L family deacetylase [Paenibacillus xylanilyticus]NUU74909.1 PIG-L family deacetylase [Paenibacillus xylanilyticus]